MFDPEPVNWLQLLMQVCEDLRCEGRQQEAALIAQLFYARARGLPPRGYGL